MATTPTDLSVVYDQGDEAFVVSFTHTGDVFIIERSDNDGYYWDRVYGGTMNAGPGTHTFVDFLAPTVGTVLYRVVSTDAGGYSEPTQPVVATATAGGFRVRRRDMPAATTPLFMSDEGALTVGYTADRSKRVPLGSTVPVIRSAPRRADTITLPGVTCFNTTERDILLGVINTADTLQLACPDGSLYWVVADPNFTAELAHTVGGGNTALWTLNLTFDVVIQP